MRSPAPPSPAGRAAALRSLAASVLLLASACVSLERPAADKRRFLLDARRPEAAPPAAEGSLLVVPFHVPGPWAGPGFVHRAASGEVQVDFLHEWFAPPGVMLADAARRWLSDAGLFAAVTGEGSRLPPGHVLEGDVLELMVDRQQDAPAAVLEIEFFLLDAGRQLVHRARLAHRTALDGDGAEAIVAAFSTCAAAVLGELEGAVRAHR